MKRRTGGFCILLAIGILAASRAAGAHPFPTLLPRDVRPMAYRIDLRPDLPALRFSGSETVDIDVRRATARVVLNQHGLRVSHASLGGGRDAAIRLDARHQTVILTFSRALPPGRHRLHLAFDGPIGQTRQGIYCWTYPTPAGPKRLLATEMEPTDARRMFPCWDEPAYRATFRLSVRVPSGFMAVSNMPVQDEKPAGEGYRTVTFARTPPMATYLVAVVAGDLASVGTTVAGIPVRVVAIRGHETRGKYALDVVKHILPYYENYFGVRYPLPKLDLIAVPGGDAMENWGAITFAEDYLLFDPATSSLSTREDVFTTVSHEIAHQWFGDLVTMGWWDDLWLNEGFATWMERKATDRFNPSWEMWLRNGERRRVMAMDARAGAHPIVEPVTDPAQAVSAFDDITYNKGAAVIRMLEAYLGEATFRKGIRAYMAAHKFGNTASADLWRALRAASGKPVGRIAATWIHQAGLPVVSCREQGKGTWMLSQEVLTEGHARAPRTWRIPIAYAMRPSAIPLHHLLLTGRQRPVHAGGDLLLLNADGSGYYRAQYDAAAFRRLLAVAPRLPAIDRIGLLDDAWALAVCARQPASDWLALVRALRGDSSYAVWGAVLDGIEQLEALERGRPAHAAFASWACGLLRGELGRIGWDAAGSFTRRALRARLVEVLGRLGDPGTLAECRRRFAEFLLRPASLPADLQRAVAVTVGREADPATFDALHKLGRQGTFEQQVRYFNALAHARDPKLTEQALAMSLGNELPPDYAVGLVAQVAAEHPKTAWAYFQAHADALLGRLPSGDRGYFAEALLDEYCDARTAGEAERMAPHLPAEMRAAVARGVAAIRGRAAFRERVLPGIDAWIARHGRPAS